MVFAWNGYSVIPNPEAIWLPSHHLNHSTSPHLVDLLSHKVVQVDLATCTHLIEQVGLKCVQVVLPSRPTEVSVIGYGVFKTLWIVNIARRHVEHSLVIVYVFNSH